MNKILVTTLAVFLAASTSFAVDKRKGLYIGSTGMPTEMSPTSDYATAKGFSFANSDNTLIDENSGIMRFYTNAILAGSIDTSGYWDLPFHMAIGNNSSAQSGVVLNLNETVALAIDMTGYVSNISISEDASSNGFFGTDINVGVTSTNGKASSLIGTSSQAYTTSSAAGTLSNQMYGGIFTANHTGTGDVPLMVGAKSTAVIDNSFGTPTATNLIGHVIEVLNPGGATVTTAAGLAIGDLSGKGTTSWAIASDGGSSYHVGNLRLGSSVAPTNKLSVTGTADISTQVTTPIVSGGTGTSDTLTLKSNDTSWPRTAKTQTDHLTVGQSFTFPTGSAANFIPITIAPSITSIDVASATVGGISVSPSYTYTTSQSWGLAPKHGISAIPTWTSAVGSGGSDSGILVGISAQPQVDTSSGSRTWANLFGIQGDPRTTGSSGTVTTIHGVRSRGSLTSGTTATSFNAFFSDFNAASGSTVSTYRGLYITPTFTGTVTNFEGVRIDDQSAPSGNNIGFYQRGTNAHNRLQGKTIIGADSAPTYNLDVNGTLTATSGNAILQQNLLSLNPASNSTATAIGIDTQISTAATASNKATTLYGQRILTSRNASDTGAISTITGAIIQPLNSAILGTGSGSVTTYIGLQVSPNDNSSTTTGTTTYRGISVGPSIGSNNVASRVYTTLEPGHFTWTYASGSTSTTVTDLNVINVDAAGNSVARTGTITNAVGLNMSGWTTAGGLGSGITFTNPPEFIRLQSSTVANSIGIRQQGSVPHNRFQGQMSIGADAAPDAYLEIQPAASTGTVEPDFLITGPANTALTASAERNTFQINPGTQQWATGSIATQRTNYFRQPTLSFVGSSTVSAAYNAQFEVPTGGTNATLTNSIGLSISGQPVTNVTNSYGLSVTATSGATNNYAAIFSSGNVGIRTLTPTVSLHVDGAIAVDSTTVSLTADAQTVSTTDISYIRVSSNNATATNRTIVLGQSTTVGQKLVIEWTHATNRGELIDDSAQSGAGNVRLNGTWTPTGANQTLSLISNGTDWIETSRSLN